MSQRNDPANLTVIDVLVQVYHRYTKPAYGSRSGHSVLVSS